MDRKYASALAENSGLHATITELRRQLAAMTQERDNAKERIERLRKERDDWEQQVDHNIAAAIAAEKFGLEIIASDIGDNQGAVTRFVLVEKPGAQTQSTGHDRTSLVAFIGKDHAGALLEILTEFANRSVNISFIHSRPTGRVLGDYHFIIDVEGHIQDPGVHDAIEAVRAICEDIRLLGSYHRVD